MLIKQGKTNVKYLLIVVILAAVVGGGTLGYLKYFYEPETVLPPTISSLQTFSTKEECKEKTGCECDFVACDYIPPGKTIEEVCGKDFKKGWQCIKPREDETADWKTYRNEEYGFEIKYPNDLNLFSDRPTGGLNLWSTYWSFPEPYKQDSKLYGIGLSVRVDDRPCHSGEKIMRNGINFDKRITDTGAQNPERIQIIIYGTPKNDACYTISLNWDYSPSKLRVYNPDTLGYEEADEDLRKKIEAQTIDNEKKILSIFDRILSTFRFLE